MAIINLPENLHDTGYNMQGRCVTIQTGVYIGPDFEMAVIEKYLITYRRDRKADLLESRLFQQNFPIFPKTLPGVSDDAQGLFDIPKLVVPERLSFWIEMRYNQSID